MVSLDNITVAFGGFTLIDNISIMINSRDRIGLVGKNGAGKSTLLKILMRLQNPASGIVSCPADISTGYLPQQMPHYDHLTVFDEVMKAFDTLQNIEKQIAKLTEDLSKYNDYSSAEYLKTIEKLNEANDLYNIHGGENREASIEQTLLGLGFKRTDFYRKTGEFSGGWRMRIELAKILLRRPHLLLLDEPTNHLDIESIQWLEDYLKSFDGALILISHDRAFLNNVTTRTIEISLGKIYDYKAPYSQFVQLRRERREQQIAAYQNQQKLIESTQDFINKFRYKPTKSNQVQSRIKQLEKIDIIEIDEEDNSALHIKFPSAVRSGQVVFEAKDLTKQFGNNVVFKDVNFKIERGNRIAFVGRNGEGKTTMARIITGELDYEQGEAKLGYKVNLGYFAQNQDTIMDDSATVFETLDRIAAGDIRTRLRDILGAFLFRGDDVDKKVKVLSGGERSRLAMAKLLIEPYNFIVLDEPTNHMDMRSKDILKDALLKYDGTLLVVSHDREFLDGLVDKIYEFSDSKVKEYLGGIYYFLQRRKIENLNEIEKKDIIAASQKNKESSGKDEYLKKKESERILRKIQTSIEKIEKQIEETEAKIADLDKKLACPEIHNLNMNDSSIFEQYNSLKSELAKQMHEWEKFNYELEVMTNA
ncbi:MAG: ABC-F family ATP-binding cassette domain-containing protein [Prevotellaceae bacterium]|nr:ABC-F family ATP-binding cassette domain-containing protein [Prevotellaceae bacterium]